jgi:AcrR family transcriptional regulator
MLSAAAELIGERGFSETRIADVARRAGASPALVIYYFATKDQLLTEALRFSEEAFYRTVTAELDTLRTARERLELLVRTTCVPQGEGEVPGAWGLWFDLWAQAFRHPEVKKDRAELDAQWRDLIARIVQDGIDHGEIQKVDVHEFAVMWSSLLDGLVIQVSLDDPVVTSALARRIALELADRELGLSAGRPRRSSKKS